MIRLFVMTFLCFANPERPGGDLTHRDFSKKAFSHPGPSLSGDALTQFSEGETFFKIGWPEAPSALSDRDGLGPTFNAISCVSCHNFAGRGVGYFNYIDHTEFDVNVSILFRFSKADNYGEQLNPAGIRGVPGEGTPQVILRFIDGLYADGTSYQLRQPQFVFKNLAYGPLPEDAQISPRVASQMIGLGLIEAISAQDILKNEDPQDLNKDGISGRAHWVPDLLTGETKLGRFGWKASQPNLLQQNAAAFSGDLGLTTNLFPIEGCSPEQVLCHLAPNGGSPEISDQILRSITDYTQTLGVPARRLHDEASFRQGEKVFHQLRCDTCHTPSFTTSSEHEVPFLRNQQIFPYSDFLLHDMGPDLADDRPDGMATGREWRTPPLWGIGLIPVVNQHQNLLHDARARNIEEAILWHGGEAENSKIEFKKLNRTSRRALIDFVNSL